MGKSKRGTSKRGASKRTSKSTKKALRALERRLDVLEADRRSLTKRLKKLGRRLDRGSPPRPTPYPGEPGGPGGPWGGRGRPPWARGGGPTVSLEVPLETNDPAAPLWASVNARLPEEISSVDDEGRVVRYRYSPVGSTPQAPRYRQVQDDPEPFRG